MNGPHASTNVRFVSISMHAHNANQTARTQRDEHNVYLARDAARMRPLGIDTKVDRTAKDLARDTVAEPVAEGLTASGGRRIRERNSTLDHPEEPSADAACGSAKEDKPGGAEDVVRVQACGINYMGGVEQVNTRNDGRRWLEECTHCSTLRCRT